MAGRGAVDDFSDHLIAAPEPTDDRRRIRSPGPTSEGRRGAGAQFLGRDS